MGRKASSIARTLLLHPHTIANWRAQIPEFRAEIERCRNENLDRMRGMIERHFADAMGELAKIAREGEDEFARLGASKARADYGTKLALALLAAQQKDQNRGESANEIAAQVRQALQEMDEASGGPIG